MGQLIRSLGGVVAVVVLYCLLSPVAFGLPAGRVYEMVTPVYKGGYGSGGPTAVAPNGEAVAFETLGVFAGVPWDSTENAYLARRNPAGWVTSGLEPPPFGTTADFSTELRYVLDSGFESSNLGTALNVTELSYLLHPTNMPDVAANWEVFGGLKIKSLDGEPFSSLELGASPDLCHVVEGHVVGEALLPEALGTQGQLYDLSRGCHGAPSQSLVAVRNKFGPNEEPEVINRKCVATLGLGTNYELNGTDLEQGSGFNTIAAEGEEIFFTTNVESGAKVECEKGVHQLFARLGGARTIEISRPPSEACEEVPCAEATKRSSAYFKGASEDGSRVFFTTSASLTGEAGVGNNLYMAEIGCPGGAHECPSAQKEVTSLALVSRDPTAGQAAEVQGVVRVAQNGGYVYFVAHGVLTQGPNVEGQAPVPGTDNLYAYDAVTGRTAFVADLCSGPALSGDIDDLHCPTDLKVGSQGPNDESLWISSGGEAQSTPDGKFLVFSSFGQLLRNDTDTAKDVYRYDVETGALDRVSLGEEGYDANGNDDESEASIVGAGLGVPGQSLAYEQQEMSTRAISEDGSRVVFSEVGPLSPKVTNDTANIYEWHKEPGWAQGKVSLISSGSALQADFGPVITPSGQDIFFATFQGLVPQDTEGESDIYDARIGGGFPEPPATIQECSGDACQGPLSTPAPVLVPGSISQSAGENFPPPGSPKVKATPKKAIKKSKARARRKAKRKRRVKATRISAPHHQARRGM